MPLAFWFLLALPILVVAFFILAKVYSVKTAYLVLSWLPVVLLLPAYIITTDQWAMAFFFNSAGISLFVVIGGVVLLLRAFENGERCLDLLIGMCLAAMPLIFVVITMFTQGY